MFFIGGIMVSIYSRYFGVLFLICHGLIGFLLMNYYLLNNIFSLPIMSDSPDRIIIYIVFLIILTIIAFGKCILYSILGNINSKSEFKIQLLFTIILILSAILPYIVDFMYSF